MKKPIYYASVILYFYKARFHDDGTIRCHEMVKALDIYRLDKQDRETKRKYISDILGSDTYDMLIIDKSKCRDVPIKDFYNTYRKHVEADAIFESVRLTVRKSDMPEDTKNYVLGNMQHMYVENVYKWII